MIFLGFKLLSLKWKGSETITVTIKLELLIILLLREISRVHKTT